MGDNIESDEIDSIQPHKKRRIHKTYLFEKEFASKEDAESTIAMENTWSKYYQTSSSAGERRTYRCKKVKYSSEQCSASLYLLFKSNSDNVVLFRAVNEHDHDQKLTRIFEMDLTIKDEIVRLYQLGITKPMQIKGALMRKGLEPPNATHLTSLLKKLRDQVYGGNNISLTALDAWLEENSTIPIEKTDPFVVHKEISLNENAPYFRFFVSSKQLLHAAINADKVHADATYKLIWQGFPVLQVGTTDMHRQFHPFGIAVCTKENRDDFRFLFEAVKIGVQTIYSVTFSPKYLICDASGAIHNGAQFVFGTELTIIMCWAHVRRNVSKKVEKFFKNSKRQLEVMHDLDHLQIAKSKEVFDKAAQFFIDKWKEANSEFCDYFEKEWLKKNRLWYEGVQNHVPSTNNALESANKVIKDRHTVRELFDLSRFRQVLFQMINEWSMLYTYGQKEFFTNPNVDLKLWTEAYNWARQNVNIHSSNEQDHVIYKVETMNNIIIVDPHEWRSFKDFLTNHFASCSVSFPSPVTKDNWLEGVCDCSHFFKSYICMHVVGIALRLRLVYAPDECKTIPIGRKRKRGRPALAKPALCMQ